MFRVEGSDARLGLGTGAAKHVEVGHRVVIGRGFALGPESIEALGRIELAEGHDPEELALLTAAG